MSIKQPFNIGIVILAAGASKRMGEPKQLLKWGKTTLLEHTLNTALQLNLKETIVVLGANYSLIKNEIENYPITILNNTDWEKGLGKSIACVANYVMSKENSLDGLLITLADQPFINTTFLNRFIDKFEPRKNLIITTLYENEKQGVPVLFDAVYFEELSILDDDKGAKHLFKTYKKHIKALIPKEKNIDLDTRDDYNLLKTIKNGS